MRKILVACLALRACGDDPVVPQEPVSDHPDDPGRNDGLVVGWGSGRTMLVPPVDSLADTATVTVEFTQRGALKKFYEFTKGGRLVEQRQLEYVCPDPTQHCLVVHRHRSPAAPRRQQRGTRSRPGTPPEIQMDRLMVQADRQIAGEQFGAALRTLDRILELQEEHDLKLPEPFWIRRAEVAVGAGDYLEAIAAATRYLEIAGREGEHYGAALEALDGAISHGCTPERMTETVESLQACLTAGADPNGVGEGGRTMLDWAAEREDPGITAALIAAGADPVVAEAAARAAWEAAMEPGTVFRDCERCPEMVVVPGGSFMMGSPESEEGRYENEGPRHQVTIGTPFAVGVYEVTFGEWDACVAAVGCGGYRPGDEGWGRGSRPVINVSWEDAREYVRWLSRETGEEYRLLTEAEWEYVARARTTTARYWGESESGQCRHANEADAAALQEFPDSRNTASCNDGYGGPTAPVGLFEPNAFGLYDVLGNVQEWTQDCLNESYSGAPADGSAWRSGNCSWRMARGGSSSTILRTLRSAHRSSHWTGLRFLDLGFRVARTIN